MQILKINIITSSRHSIDKRHVCDGKDVEKERMAEEEEEKINDFRKQRGDRKAENANQKVELLTLRVNRD